MKWTAVLRILFFIGDSSLVCLIFKENFNHIPFLTANVTLKLFEF